MRRPYKQSTKQGDAKGASEVRCRTFSIHFHCPALVLQSNWAWILAFLWMKLLHLQLEACCLQASFFAYNNFGCFLLSVGTTLLTLWCVFSAYQCSSLLAIIGSCLQQETQWQVNKLPIRHRKIMFLDTGEKKQTKNGFLG